MQRQRCYSAGGWKRANAQMRLCVQPLLLDSNIVFILQSAMNYSFLTHETHENPDLIALATKTASPHPTEILGTKMPKHTPQTAPDPRDSNTKDDFAPSTNPRLHPSTPPLSRPPSHDWDAERLERLAKEYVSMRKEIWQGLATRVGEKWIDVEAKCMHSGLQNLLSAAQSAVRREEPPQLPWFRGDQDSAIDLTPVYENECAQGYNQITYSMGDGFLGSLVPMPVSETNYNVKEAWEGEYYSQDADSSDIRSKNTTKDALEKNGLSLSSKQRSQLPAQITSQKFPDLVVNDTAAKNSGYLSDAAMSKESDEKNQIGQSPPFNHDLEDTIHEITEQRSRHTPAGAQKTRHPISPSLVPPESDSESSSLDERQELLTHLRPKKLLVDRLMDYFFQIFSRCHSSSPASNSYCLTNEATTTSLTPSASTSQQSQDPRKRKRASDNGDKDGDDASERGRGKIPKLEDSSIQPKRLACPYFKKDPLRFQTKQSCCGPGWETVHRLKEHLDRNHCLPISCLRCYAPFDTEAERDFHMRSAEQCELRDPPAPIEGFNASQRVELKSRPRSLKSMSEPQKWRRVYLILFPGTPEIDIPSPHYEFQTPRDHGHPVDLMMEYEEYLQRELPLRVRQQLEVRVERALDPVEEALRGQLVEIVRDVQLELFQLFRSAIPSVDDQDAHRTPRLNSDTNSDEQSEPRNIDQQEPRAAGQVVDPTFGGLGVSLNSANALAARRPEPYLDWNLGEFDGQLFDFRELMLHTEDSDLAYGIMSSTANLNQKATEET
ncbi:hypothetical protein NUW58_g3592 [Xylaria curta]|uniref:Uncharacterized protein n=1 Tax=Xylaria curta TaxID=42375 RepID=A0ACC1PCY0_9PEZI|nr:hypothetical protein NUW58_g3592 [Xylaria curta]